MARDHPAYALLAEFERPEALLEAARRTRAAGYRSVEAYTPLPVHGLAEALGHDDRRLPWIVLACGIVGGAGGYFLQWYSAVIDYPIDVGGRPLHSWPAFVPVAFELTILGAALGAVLGMLGLNGLPQPYHPLFNAPGFELASRSRFFLAIETRDPFFDREATERFLRSLDPASVSEVPR